MAWLEQHSVAGTYQLVFRLGGVKFKRSLKTLDEREATTRLARVEENIRLVESGRLVLPEQADPAAFLLSDGQLNGKPQVAERLPLAKLMERYKASLPDGALESESLRIEAATILIREKKRTKGKRTTRMVPMTARLKRELETWFAAKAPSPFAFPAEHQVERTRRPRFEEGCVSPDQASHQLERVLASTKWEKIRGWHIFRHSFISNCASCGVDQRMIDSWVGHQTDEMRRRYTHLFPHAQHAALAGVFAEPAALA